MWISSKMGMHCRNNYSSSDVLFLMCKILEGIILVPRVSGMQSRSAVVANSQIRPSNFFLKSKSSYYLQLVTNKIHQSPSYFLTSCCIFVDNWNNWFSKQLHFLNDDFWAMLIIFNKGNFPHSVFVHVQKM